MQAILLPIALPMLAGALCLISWHRQTLQLYISLITAVLLVANSFWMFSLQAEHGILVLQLGGWAAPFGISLVADTLTNLMVMIAAFIYLATLLYSLASQSDTSLRFGYLPLLNLMMAGVMGSFVTGDIFNLYVWFEIMLIASFGLLVLGGEKAQLRGAIKYVAMNLLSSALFLTAIGLLYGLVGTLNMADVAVKIQALEDQRLIIILSMLFLVAFGIKAAAFPLFFWLPASYHTPAVAVSAVFAGLLTKVGVYVLFRFFTLIFTQDLSFTHQSILLWAGILTMVIGVLGAAAQMSIRRILSVHIISQIGYMLIALALFSPLAIAGGIFYILHNIVVKTNLFFISGIIYFQRGTFDLKKLGGLYKDSPWLAIVFLLSALSLAGLPPLSGFFAKFIVISAIIAERDWWTLFFAVTVSLLTLFSMLKIWSYAFWGKAPEHEPETLPVLAGSKVWLWLPVGFLAFMSLGMGLAAEFFFQYAQQAAFELLHPELYIQAVLGG